MKKIKGKSCMREDPHNLSLIIKGADQRLNDLQEQMILGPNGVYYSQYDDIEEVIQNDQKVDAVKNPEKIGKNYSLTHSLILFLVEDYQYSLLHNRTP